MTMITIDDYACWGCKTCELACKQEMQPMVGVQLIRVTEEGPRMDGPDPYFTYRVHLCQHCEDLPCAEVCPEAAFTKRPDGIVVLDETICSGCEACLESCPYEAIAFDDQHQVARKCNLCHHRVDAGLIPACADNVCLAHCIDFRPQNS